MVNHRYAISKCRVQVLEYFLHDNSKFFRHLSYFAETIDASNTYPGAMPWPINQEPWQVCCREVYFLLAALCLLVGATTTHGLGGSLRHKQTGPFTMGLGSDVDPRQPDPVTTWRFYQPFR